MMEKLLYPPNEAAQLLSISPRLLWQLQADGKIQVTRISRLTFYAADELRRFVQQQTTQADAQADGDGQGGGGDA